MKKTNTCNGLKCFYFSIFDHFGWGGSLKRYTAAEEEMVYLAWLQDVKSHVA